MWTNLIEKIPEDQLTTWFGCLTLLALLVLPILIGFCGLAAWKIGDRISSIKDADNRKTINEHDASLIRTQTELDNARQTAEDARVVATQIQESQAPWELSKHQKDKFLAYIKDAPKGKVAIEHIGSDGKRSHDFALEIKKLLEAAGYEVWGYIPAFQQASGVPLVGVQIQIKDQQSDMVGGYIQRAFKTIGIEAGGVHRTDNNYGNDFVVILIGIKP